MIEMSVTPRKITSCTCIFEPGTDRWPNVLYDRCCIVGEIQAVGYNLYIPLRVEGLKYNICDIKVKTHIHGTSIMFYTV